MGADPDREPPFYFQKPSDAATDTANPSENGKEICTVPYPSMTANFHHEVELVVAIGKGGRNISAGDVPNHIFGYGVGCDLTRRDLQAEAKKGGKPWCSSKGFDSSAPCGSIVPTGEIELVPSTRIALEVNGELKQESTLDQLTWSIPEAVSILSQYYCLKPGDLIFTGTPAGVGPLQIGDVVRATCGDLPECVFKIGPKQT